MSITEIEEMASGECCWIGREDVHVYCHHPMVETMMPWGRLGWTRRPEDARYCVVCPDEGVEYLPYHEWITAAEAWRIVDRILAGKATRKAG